VIPAAAIARSLRLYHAPERRPALDAFHRRFLALGELAFDVGCHVGDRAASFLRLGARVVAVEPQPRLARTLRLLFHRAPDFTLEEVLLGATPGEAVLRLNRANPTVATASDAFIAAATGAPGWEGQSWDAELRLPRTTLDALVARHGMPEFIKIDVEGWEAEVLAGLTAAPRALSFEFTTIQRDVAHAALARLSALGLAHFTACLGESMEWAFPRAVPAAEMAAWLNALPPEANSGDVYASRELARLSA
jgi:FkbM family methyltransferase